MLIISTDQTDVYRNLALEEWLLDHAERYGTILFLCVNDPCVVIGKNQNPWRECRLSLMQKKGIALARRISGGGAVYHDKGNLNIGVITSRTQYRENKQYELIFRTLEKLGIQGMEISKNSLTVKGGKFSGQASSFRKQHILHHGTLLIHTNLDHLNRYLGPDLEGIETKAVASVPVNVVNLSTFAPNLTIKKTSSMLIKTFKKMYGKKEKNKSWSNEQILQKKILPIIKKNSSKDWKFNRTPRFQITQNGQTLQVERGRITTMEGNPPFTSQSCGIHTRRTKLV